jgi:hypothetical protein
MRLTTLIFAAAAILFFPSCLKINYLGSIEKVQCPRFSPIKIIENTPQISIVSDRCDDYTYKSEKVYEAIQYFVEEFAYEFEVEEKFVWTMLSGLRIQFSAIPREAKNVYDVHGKFYEEHPVSGLALNKNWIWVETRTRYICESSLAHELAHILIWRTQGTHGDPDHEGSEYSGWTEQHTELIKLVNEALCELGT